MAKSWHHGDSGFSVKWFSTRTQKLSGVGKQLFGPWSSIQQMTLRLRCYFDYTVRPRQYDQKCAHYSGVIMSMMASQNTVVSIVCSTVCSGAHQRKDQSSASLAFVRGIHGWPVNSPHKRPVTRKVFPFDDVIMRRKFHIQNSLKFVSDGSIDNKSALEPMAWHWSGNRLISEPMNQLF